MASIWGSSQKITARAEAPLFAGVAARRIAWGRPILRVG